jgi:hypothetical protein
MRSLDIQDHLLHDMSLLVTRVISVESSSLWSHSRPGALSWSIRLGPLWVISSQAGISENRSKSMALTDLEHTGYSLCSIHDRRGPLIPVFIWHCKPDITDISFWVVVIISSVNLKPESDIIMKINIFKNNNCFQHFDMFEPSAFLGIYANLLKLPVVSPSETILFRNNRI